MPRSALAGLLPLFLLLHSANAESLELKSSLISKVRPKEQVQLRCTVSRPDTVTSCNWLFQGPDPRAVPEFRVYISTRVTVHPDLSGISGKKESPGVFVLTLESFEERHQGYYFCAVSSKSILHFSDRVKVFLPGSTSVVPTAKPTTTLAPRPPTRAPRTPSQPLSPSSETCQPSSRKAKDTQGLDFSCNIYIWAPLAGTCAILLISLVTVLVCIRRNRRRVCKCPRPQVRLGGKSSPSERYV